MERLARAIQVGAIIIITSVLIKAKRSKEEIGDVMMEARGWHDDRRGHEPRHAGGPQSWKRQRHRLSLEPPEGTGPVDLMTFSQ